MQFRGITQNVDKKYFSKHIVQIISWFNKFVKYNSAYYVIGLFLTYEYAIGRAS